LIERGITDAADDDEDASQVWVAHGGKYLGRIILRDKPRAEAREALDAMRQFGIQRVILLTGDRAAAAREVGDILGVDQVVAEVLPAQKLEVVRAEQAAGRVVMMVGDGVNDAPALRGADVGVAVGAELNEVALGGADVALLGTDLGRLPKLIRLADITRKIISQNAWLAFGFAVVLIGLAAAGVLSPLSGALAQSVAVLAIVANSARVLRIGNKLAAGSVGKHHESQISETTEAPPTT
jgi:P-type E1-E2 ATPase